MRLRERMYELTAPEEVDEFLEKFPHGAIFKAGGCHKTMQGFSYVEEALDPREGVSIGFIRVIESRPASNHVAECLQITHESPQFILLSGGKVIFDLDNWDITPQALEAGLEHHLGPVEKRGERVTAVSDMSAYLGLLRKYASEELSESEFRSEWLSTFQRDATPRSKEEFDLLNTIYGDVDAAIAAEMVGIGSEKKGAEHTSIKERAAKVLEMLESVGA